MPLPLGRKDRDGSLCHGDIENDGMWWPKEVLEVVKFMLLWLSLLLWRRRQRRKSWAAVGELLAGCSRQACWRRERDDSDLLLGQREGRW